MNVKLKYKKQGDGRDTWHVIKFADDGKTVIDSQMHEGFSVPTFKLKNTLNQRGLLLSVNAAIESMDEPNKSAALSAWSSSSEVNINSNTAKFVQTALGLTNDEVAEIFETSNNLNL